MLKIVKYIKFFFQYGVSEGWKVCFFFIYFLFILFCKELFFIWKAEFTQWKGRDKERLILQMTALAKAVWQAKARSFFQVSHVDTRAQALGLPSTDFLGSSTESWIKSGAQPEVEAESSRLTTVTQHQPFYLGLMREHWLMVTQLYPACLLPLFLRLGL